MSKSVEKMASKIVDELSEDRKSTPESDGSKVLKELGFDKCEFGPDNDPCEQCGKRNVQLYFGNRGYWDSRDGDYWCLDCVLKAWDQLVAETAYDFTIHNP